MKNIKIDSRTVIVVCAIITILIGLCLIIYGLSGAAKTSALEGAVVWIPALPLL